MKNEQMRTLIPDGARELLDSCRSYDEILGVCEAQKYSCHLTHNARCGFVTLQFRDPVTGAFRAGMDEAQDIVFVRYDATAVVA